MDFTNNQLSKCIYRNWRVNNVLQEDVLLVD
jgi:hypothetical protein